LRKRFLEGLEFRLHGQALDAGTTDDKLPNQVHELVETSDIHPNSSPRPLHRLRRLSPRRFRPGIALFRPALRILAPHRLQEVSRIRRGFQRLVPFQPGHLHRPHLADVREGLLHFVRKFMRGHAENERLVESLLLQLLHGRNRSDDLAEFTGPGDDHIRSGRLEHARGIQCNPDFENIHSLLLGLENPFPLLVAHNGTLLLFPSPCGFPACLCSGNPGVKSLGKRFALGGVVVTSSTNGLHHGGEGVQTFEEDGNILVAQRELPLPDQIEHVLHGMRQMSHDLEPHGGGHALERMRDPEYLVHTPIVAA